MRTVAVTSGKGGVGKTNVSVNLGYALAARGHRVLLLDADIGLANLDVVLGVNPALNLQNVVRGECLLLDAIAAAPGGVHILAGASGLEALVELDGEVKSRLLDQLIQLQNLYDYLILDTGAGLGQNLLTFLEISDSVLMVVTPDPASMSDSYATLKAHHLNCPHVPIDVVVNMVTEPNQGEAVFQRLQQVARQYLGTDLRHLGSIQLDTQALNLIRARKPFYLSDPKVQAARDIDRVADSLCGIERSVNNRPSFGERFFSIFSKRSVA